MRRFRCTECKDEWEAPAGAEKSSDLSCPSCGGSRIRRASSLANWRPLAGAVLGQNLPLMESRFLAPRTVASPDADFDL